MTLHVRAGVAFRQRTKYGGVTSDFIRVDELEDGELILLASGSESGFSVYWPPAARRVLELFEEQWPVSKGPALKRLNKTFERVSARFGQEAKGMAASTTEPDSDKPAATLLAAVRQGAMVDLAWIGAERAVLARGLRVVAASSPHTLREQFRRDPAHAAADLSAVPDLATRVIDENARTDPPGMAAFQLEPGDTLVLLNRECLDGPLSAADVAFAAGMHASPEILADRIAQLAFTQGGAVYAAVCVLRYDAIDVRATIEQLIDTYEPEPQHGAGLQRWAHTQRALPASFDVGGVYGLRGDGSVVRALWDDPLGSTREEKSPAVHAAALVGAATLYPELAKLAPLRPLDAQRCACCAALEGAGEQTRGCASCWYLGWQPPAAPAWYRG